MGVYGTPGGGRHCASDGLLVTAVSPRVRMFFAAVPDAAARADLAAAADALPLASDARRVPRENYHVTLAFVGEIAASQVPTLRQIGAGLRIPRFTLGFDAYEYWPKPEVVVAAARTVPVALKRLWHELHGELAAHHWALDPKRLRPHVTLARKVSQAPVLQALSSFEWMVNDFCLMRSDTSGPQSVYTVVDTWPLLDESAET